MKPSSRIRILLVDDHFVVRAGLRSILDEEEDMEVVGEAPNGLKAVEAWEALTPHVTLMDLRMPVCSGVEAARLIRARDPGARILVLSSYEGDEEIHAALEAGATGYLLKHSSSEQIVPAIRALAAGKKWIPRDVAEQLANRKRSEPLTQREREILQLLATGLANKEVGGRFGLTEGTVKWHVKNILGKLQVPDRTAAVTVALRRGIIQLP